MKLYANQMPFGVVLDYESWRMYKYIHRSTNWLKFDSFKGLYIKFRKSKHDKHATTVK